MRIYPQVQRLSILIDLLNGALMIPLIPYNPANLSDLEALNFSRKAWSIDFDMLRELATKIFSPVKVGIWAIKIKI
jgi:hypothetical protein